MEYPKIYRFSITTAKDRGEMDLFRASHKLNVACRHAIESAIRENFDGMRLKKSCLRPVMEKYGADRVNWVLANTVRQKEYDGRFCADNKKWAESFHFPDSDVSGRDLRLDFVVDSHPAVLDGFIRLTRQEHKGDREKAERIKKPGETERPDKPEKPEKSEEPDKPERLEKSEEPDKSERPEKPQKPGNRPTIKEQLSAPQSPGSRPRAKTKTMEVR